jgi:hypothetical protein
MRYTVCNLNYFCDSVFLEFHFSFMLVVSALETVFYSSRQVPTFRKNILPPPLWQKSIQKMCYNPEHHNIVTCIVLWKTQCLTASSHFRSSSQLLLAHCFSISHCTCALSVLNYFWSHSTHRYALFHVCFSRIRRTRLVLAHNESEGVEINNQSFMLVTTLSLFGTQRERAILHFSARNENQKGDGGCRSFEREACGGEAAPPP